MTLKAVIIWAARLMIIGGLCRLSLAFIVTGNIFIILPKQINAVLELTSAVSKLLALFYFFFMD